MWDNDDVDSLVGADTVFSIGTADDATEIACRYVCAEVGIGTADQNERIEKIIFAEYLWNQEITTGDTVSYDGKDKIIQTFSIVSGIVCLEIINVEE